MKKTIIVSIVSSAITAVLVLFISHLLCNNCQDSSCVKSEECKKESCEKKCNKSCEKDCEKECCKGKKKCKKEKDQMDRSNHHGEVMTLLSEKRKVFEVELTETERKEIDRVRNIFKEVDHEELKKNHDKVSEEYGEELSGLESIVENHKEKLNDILKEVHELNSMNEIDHKRHEDMVLLHFLLME